MGIPRFFFKKRKTVMKNKHEMKSRAIAILFSLVGVSAICVASAQASVVEVPLTSNYSLNNLFYNSTYRELQTDMLLSLLEWMVQTGDITPLQEDSRALPDFPAPAACDAWP